MEHGLPDNNLKKEKGIHTSFYLNVDSFYETRYTCISWNFKLDKNGEGAVLINML